MGISFSCSGDDALDRSLDAILRTITLGDVDYDEHSPLRSLSFNGSHGAGPVILKSWGSGKLIIKGYLSFNYRDQKDPFHLETKFSITAPSSEAKPETFTSDSKRQRPASGFKRTRLSTLSESSLELDRSPKHQAAAVKLQKVYKSFRTRRQLADCAVLVEQRWWKLLDFALLKRSSVSFFDIERPESVISKWSRAKSRAAKVGKGLSKNEKAQKLALQHWLEAIDPRHRYGHNLHFYYDCWLRCESRQPFFYWLDVGEGKEISLEEKCPRSKLQQQCIKYLGPKEREVYEVVVEDGKFLYKKSRQVLDTSQGPKDSKWIFVLSTSRTLYVGQKKKGRFQHSSFLAGGATSAAGRLEVDNGILKAVWPHSGHYRPTEENFQELVGFLKENNVDLTNVKESPSGEEEELWSKVVSSRSEADSTWSNNAEENEEQLIDDVLRFMTTHPRTVLKRAKSCEVSLKQDPDTKSKHSEGEEADSKMDQQREINATVSEEHYMFRKRNLFVGSEEPLSVPLSVPSELILRRMNSKKGLKSLQLGKQLSCKWTTGAGPRIGCVRDYPSELQARALEQVCLSPRSSVGASRFGPSLH